MTEPLTVRPQPGPNCWVLHPPVHIWEEDYLGALTIELHDKGLDARANVDVWWPPAGADYDLSAFLHALAEDWRGWPDVRRWRSMDAKMTIDAQHDGAGHVRLSATLRHDSSSPDAWSAQVSITVEAGEQLSQLAADVSRLFGDQGGGPVARG